jgi:outer membrane protein OmpA-like peptidoglycan-associated protein
MLKRFIGILMIGIVLSSFCIINAAGEPQDRAGSKDPPLFSRMPGFFIFKYTELEFNRYEFTADGGKKVAVEGHYYEIGYKVKPGIQKPSPLQVNRNYINAAKAIGGQQVANLRSGWASVVKVVKNNMETWVYINAYNEEYHLIIVEKQLMEQDVTANAGTMAASIKDTGKAAIYGIYFDSGKAIVKPESDLALKEISKMLQADPNLKLYVVGHTDNQGGYDYNMKLSKDRADAVVKALVSQYNVNASRLRPCGVGPVAPVASNLTEEGQVKNRRVELVEQ